MRPTITATTPSHSNQSSNSAATPTSTSTDATATEKNATMVSVPAPFELSGGLFVNAAGAWAGQLIQTLASHSQRPQAIASLPVQPRKRCIFTVLRYNYPPPPPPFPQHLLPQTLISPLTDPNPTLPNLP